MIRKNLSIGVKLPVQVKASFWFLICVFLQRGIQFITIPIFTRIMDTTEYGQFDIFNSWLGILTIFISLNLYSGVYSRGVVKFEAERNVFSSSMQGLSMTLVLGWSVVYFLFHSFWNKLFSLSTIQMVLMFLIIWGTSAFSFWSTEQRVVFKYKSLIVITLIMSAAKPILGIIFVHLSVDKVTARIFAIAIVEVLIGIILFARQMNQGKTFFSSKYWSYAVRFNIPLIPHYLSTTILSSADRIMIGRMVSASTAGIYGLAYSISLVMTMFNNALMQTIEPWLYRKINEKRINDISKVAYPSFILIAAVNVILIALAPEAVALFAPAEYYDAIWIIPPVTMSVFFTFSYTFFAVFEFYYEKTKLIATATCTGAALNIILNYIFIKIFGYYAAGYTTLLCYIIYAVFHLMFMQRICQKELNNEQPYDIRIYIGIAFIFLAIGFIFMASYNYIIIRYAMLGIMLLLAAAFHKKIIKAVGNIINKKM